MERMGLKWRGEGGIRLGLVAACGTPALHAFPPADKPGPEEKQLPTFSVSSHPASLGRHGTKCVRMRASKCVWRGDVEGVCGCVWGWVLESECERDRDPYPTPKHILLAYRVTVFKNRCLFGNSHIFKSCKSHMLGKVITLL